MKTQATMSMRWLKSSLTALVALLMCAPLARGSVVGVWSGSERSWTSPFISNLSSWLTLAGHSILNPTVSTPTPAMEVFIVSEPEVPPTPAFIGALAAWINAGGKLIVLTDLGLPLADVDTILCSVASNTVSYGGCGTSLPVVPLLESSAAIDSSVVTTQPGNIVATALTGRAVQTSPGLKVTGGNALVGDYARWIAVGQGFVFVFGDRFDHNALLPGPPTVNANAELFLALVNLNLERGGDGGAGDIVIPEPSALFLLPVALLALRRRRLQC